MTNEKPKFDRREYLSLPEFKLIMRLRQLTNGAHLVIIEMADGQPALFIPLTFSKVEHIKK